MVNLDKDTPEARKAATAFASNPDLTSTGALVGEVQLDFTSMIQTVLFADDRVSLGEKGRYLGLLLKHLFRMYPLKRDPRLKDLQRKIALFQRNTPISIQGILAFDIAGFFPETEEAANIEQKEPGELEDIITTVDSTIDALAASYEETQAELDQDTTWMNQPEAMRSKEAWRRVVQKTSTGLSNTRSQSTSAWSSTTPARDAGAQISSNGASVA